MYLRKVTLKRDTVPSFTYYPFSIDAIKNLQELHFTKPVTFFVGENGSGKSTLLEAIADQCGFNTAGGGRNNTYNVDAAESILSEYLKLSWMPKVSRGFFLRAETFYHFASYIDQASDAVVAYGGRSLHHQSHGEAFFSLFINRFQGKSIYLLDEPEAALSPQRQLAFLKVLHDLVTKEACQFIIATHSPILLGFPGATIYSFDEEEIKEIAYEMTEHYQITRYFLENRERYLHEIFKEEDSDF